MHVIDCLTEIMAEFIEDKSEIPSTSNFHQHFRQNIQILQNEITTLDDSNLSASQRQNTTTSILSRVTKLNAELADASGELLSYDQRSYNNALKDVQDRLAIAQASYAPRPKFSFKSKRLAAATSEANSASTSRSATPSHLREPEGAIAGSKPTPAFAEPSVFRASSPDVPLKHLGDPSTGDSTTRGRYKYIRYPHEANEALRAERSHPLGVIADLEDSVISTVVGSESSLPLLTLSNVHRSLVVAPNIRGPVHMTGLQRSTLILSCHQFRMHDAHDVDVYLFCSSRPIIEDCTGIRFTQLPSTFLTKNEQSTNMYDQVDDFKWLRADPSPNWRLMGEGEAIDTDVWLKVDESIRALNLEDRDQSADGLIKTVLATVAIAG